MPATATYTLNTGLPLPAVGLGCWMGEPAGDKGSDINEETYQMVRKGLELGYTHFDTANGYGNEEAVGRAIRDSGVKRENLFITTKLNNSDHARVKEAFEESLEALGSGYIDLYLMHWPLASPFGGPAAKPLGPSDSPTFSETWAAMEELLKTHEGKVKNIGVSNFSIQNLEILFKTAKVVPAVNQAEGHPYLPNDKLAAYCSEKGIHLTAYSPVGQGAASPVLNDPLVAKLADKYAKSAGQVLLSWGVQRGWSVVPKSSNPKRLEENLAVFELEKEDMEALSSLHKEEGKYTSLCDYGLSPTDDSSVLFGWRIKEDLGWDYPISVRDDGGWGAKMRAAKEKEGK
ncbi:hypothetical protein JCM6882_006516 [Rhodosporidiobolus microsporus]